MGRVIRIGSRESRLAVVQAELVAREIKRRNPQFETELVTMKTTGDRILDRGLEKIGGKGLFVRELDQALLDGRIDIAVHSLKDMPMEAGGDLPILAYSRREDARDALVCRPRGEGTEEGNRGNARDEASGTEDEKYKLAASGFDGEGVIGTSSRRRKIQLQRLYPGAMFRGIRGNVQTRLQKLAEEGYDATVLAAAGLFCAKEAAAKALGRASGNYEWLLPINSRESERAALAERQFVATLGGGCTSPVAAHAKVRGNELWLIGLYFEDKSGEYFTDIMTGDVGQARQIGEMLAERMRRRGG